MRDRRAPRVKLGRYPVEAVLDGDQARDRFATPGNEDFTAFLDFVQQGGELVLGLEKTADAQGGDCLARLSASLC